MQRAHDIEIQTAWVNLADREQRLLEPEMLHDARFELVHLVGVATEQRELVELRADRALESSHRVTRNQFIDPLLREQQFLTEHRDAFSKRGGLRRDVVRATGDHQVAELRGTLRQQAERGHRLEAYDLQGAGDLELLYVLGQIAAREPEMNELPFGQIGKFLDARLHVVKRGAFAFGDAREVHVGAHALVVPDCLGRDRDPEVALRLHDGDPKIALQQNAPVRRPRLLHGRRGVALGEDVGNGIRGGVVLHHGGNDV